MTSNEANAIVGGAKDGSGAPDLMQILRATAFIRAFEHKILTLSQESPPKIAGSLHLCAGQEVAALASVAALNRDDQITATYRGHGWALAAGLSPKAVFAEICHRADGLNQGRGGSAYMMDPTGRFLGENSIVGAGTTITCGVALANLAAGNGRVVLTSIGDGAMNQGSVHEAMAFAAARALPVLFIVENNGWSELTPTGDMFRIDRLAQRARGYGIPSATVDGTDPHAVHHSIAQAAEHARSGQGPSLLEFQVPRLWGHYNRDVEHYRTKADRAAAEARDPLITLRNKAMNLGLITETSAAALVVEETERVAAIAAEVLAMPAADIGNATQHVVALTPKSAEPMPVETQTMTYIQAVNAALRDVLESDPKAVLYGEDVGNSGGIFQAARYLQRDFGEERVFDTPIAENAILGSAVGAALSGLRPVVEIMWADFVFVAIDQLINQAANVRYITGGQANVPMVVRMQQGVTPGSCAQHSQSIEAILAHVPGLKLALAATAEDAYEILRSAAADPDPCVVIEARALYPTKGEVTRTDTAHAPGAARQHRKGSDAAIITWGTMLPKALDAADALKAEGIDVAVLDLRWLRPLDEESLRDVVKQAGGNVVVAHEAVRTGGFGAEIIARLHEMLGEGFVRARRVTTPDVRMPACPDWQAELIPDADAIVRAVKEVALI